MHIHQPLCLATIILLCQGGSLAVAEDGIEVSGQTMGTYYKVTVYGVPKGTTGEALSNSIKTCLNSVNQQMSTWDAESEISQFNQSTSSDWFPVSAGFAKVVVEAQRIHQLTKGAFDPTVSPVIDLWGFGDHRDRKVPDDRQIQDALAKTGMKHIESRMQPPAIRKDMPEIQLNLSAIAKGYGVDAVAETLQNMGISSFLVDIGGEARSGAAKPNGSKWQLGIESPLGNTPRIIPLINESIATSGDYRNFFEIDGKKYSHAMNPLTGRPVVDPPASVTVLQPSCMTADAFATALMVMKPEDAVSLAKSENLSVLFQRIDDSDVVQTTGTGKLAEKKKSQGAPIWFPFAAAAVIFLLAVGAMSLGTMIQDRQIKGSCGGLASLPGHDGSSACEFCAIPKDQCKNAENRERLQTGDQQPVPTSASTTTEQA